jgi:hypothetical protein
MIGQQKTVQTSTKTVSVKSQLCHALSTDSADMLKGVWCNSKSDEIRDPKPLKAAEVRVSC